MATNFADYFVFNGHTYKAFKEKVTWPSAKALCEAKGGHLAVVNSPGVQAFLETFLEDPVWIGAYNPTGVLSGWTWITGQPWTYANWGAGQPDYMSGTDNREPYAQIGIGANFNGGKWNNWAETSTCYYICEWDRDITGEDTYMGPKEQPDDWYSVPTKPFILRGKLKPDDETPVECKFFDDNFSPDFELDVRIATIPLIKGSAVQINRPSASLHIVSIGNGLFLSRQDYILCNLLYHSNLIGEPEPYPMEFLVLREEDLELELPNGYIYKVLFAEAPSMQPQKMSQGRWLYSFQCKFRIISDENEQEEI